MRQWSETVLRRIFRYSERYIIEIKYASNQDSNLHIFWSSLETVAWVVVSIVIWKYLNTHQFFDMIMSK